MPDSLAITPGLSPETAADLEARIRRKLLRQNFMHLIGADLTTIAPGRVEAELDLGQRPNENHNHHESHAEKRELGRGQLMKETVSAHGLRGRHC